MDSDLMHALACAYAREPDGERLQAALQAALPLCALIARRFSGRGVEYEDLYHVASLSCVQALKSFDPDKGLKFSSFVTPSLTGKVRNFIRDKSSLLRTPRAVYEQAAQLTRAREEYLRLHREEPTPRALADRLGWDLPKVLTVLSARAAKDVSSLDQTDEEGLTLGQRLPGPEAGFEQMEQRQDLRRALATLSPREQALLTLRYQHKLSQRETARRLGMSQMQVSRAEQRALAALRKEMEA